jgi:hypothetical protein
MVSALPRIAHHRDGRGKDEPYRKGDIESHPWLVFTDDGEPDIRAGGERQQQRRHLCQPKLLHQPLR